MAEADALIAWAPSCTGSSETGWASEHLRVELCSDEWVFQFHSSWWCSCDWLLRFVEDGGADFVTSTSMSSRLELRPLICRISCVERCRWLAESGADLWDRREDIRKYCKLEDRRSVIVENEDPGEMRAKTWDAMDEGNHVCGSVTFA